MAERAAELLEIHFPGMPTEWTWHRLLNKGFATVPRTLPIAMQAIDEHSKGQPAGHTLFCLWARAPDHPLVVIENPATFAAEAGFKGARAVDTWRRRMKFLRANWFLTAKPGPSGDFHYVLLLNPNAAVEWMRAQGAVQDELYGRLWDRALEVGAGHERAALHALWASQAQPLPVQAAAAEPPEAQAPGLITSDPKTQPTGG